jgi:hypothetical protein
MIYINYQDVQVSVTRRQQKWIVKYSNQQQRGSLTEPSPLNSLYLLFFVLPSFPFSFLSQPHQYSKRKKIWKVFLSNTTTTNPFNPKKVGVDYLKPNMSFFFLSKYQFDLHCPCQLDKNSKMCGQKALMIMHTTSHNNNIEICRSYRVLTSKRRDSTWIGTSGIGAVWLKLPEFSESLLRTYHFGSHLDRYVNVIW